MSIFIENYKIAMLQGSDFFPILGIQEFNEKLIPSKNLLYHELRGERLIESPHKHDFFIIMLFEKGGGTHSIDFVNYPIEDHQIHLLFPGQVHEWKIEKNSIAYQLMVSREWFEHLIPYLRFATSYYQNHPVIAIDSKEYRLLLQEFTAIHDEMSKKEILWDIIQTRINLIALLVSQCAATKFEDFEKYNATPILSRYLAYIDRYYTEEKSVSFYADKLNITPNYLNILSKRTLDVSASSLIQDRLVLEAKRLLKSSELSMKDIVYSLGFYDHANFAKFFKKKTGMTPSEFREGS
ncbi:helix-turn-helix domain-containing protein [Sphingobacterium tabacisoli]|uniref:Helix-turn-helix domain-containing protein n=1 Tax=Sphingobacterium tabacisoli TaxID=2044855 RepID=A0ABW5L422_9SPHI|nr:helix-turn-helix domain-containing protein [Sphingobacterium tabacisoli]